MADDDTALDAGEGKEHYRLIDRSQEWLEDDEELGDEDDDEPEFSRLNLTSAD